MAKPGPKSKEQKEIEQLKAEIELLREQLKPVAYAPEGDDETLIESGFGGAVGIAIRTAEDHQRQTFRTLITIRAGTQVQKVKFSMGPGSYGSGGITTQEGGGPGGEPPCP